MKKNRVYVVTPIKIKEIKNRNWGEDMAYYKIVFARSKEQAAAAFAIEACSRNLIRDPEKLGTVSDNHEAPYVYQIRVSARELRKILGKNAYHILVETAGAAVLDGEHGGSKLVAHKLMSIFMGSNAA